MMVTLRRARVRPTSGPTAYGYFAAGEVRRATTADTRGRSSPDLGQNHRGERRVCEAPGNKRDASADRVSLAKAERAQNEGGQSNGDDDRITAPRPRLRDRRILTSH
jgi:hypothetical protein